MGSTNNGSNNGESASSAVNPDKAIARLLYAMLKQKSLKDIDWPQVASDPALLETISNGHAARMRYARFRASVDNQVQKKQAADAASAKDGDNKDEEDDKTAVQQTLSRTVSKSKKEKTRKATVKRSRDADGDSDAKSIAVKTVDDNFDQKENKDQANDDFMYPELFADNSLTDIQDNKNTLKQDPASLETKTFEKATEELLSQTSFTSSLPSPPTESVPSMESLAHQERKAKMRKMYAFSPTMKAGTLHQIPLPRGTAMASSSRIHSLPTLPTATASPSSATTPVNLSSALMMRHHSAGSMNDIGPQLQQQQQQQMLRQTRLMTPSSDSDLLNNPHHGHHQQYFAHHTQIPLMTDPAVVGGLDPTFDFGSLSTNHSAGANAGGSSTTGHPSPWMATPFSSPPMPTFDIFPYTTALDFVGGGTNTDGSPAGETQSMPSLFQTQYDSQQQQQQEALQTSMMAQAFTKHSGWNVMLGQASSSNQNHHI